MVHFLRFFVSLKKQAIRSFPLFKRAMWANRSGRSPKMSIVSESLRLLTKNERIAHFFEQTRSFAHFFAKKRAIRSEIDEGIPNPDVNQSHK